MPRNCRIWRTPANDKIMPFWFPANGFYNGIAQPFFAIITKRPGKISIIILTKTHIKLASTSHPNTVA
jgi:hypothetical protein